MEEQYSASNQLKVFITYSREDIDFVDQLEAALSLNKFSVTIDRYGISAGEDWKKRLGNLISAADTLVFVVSPAAARSEICEWEVEEAARLGKKILPILCRDLENTAPPRRLAELQYIYFYHDERLPGSGFGTGLVQLVEALNTDLDWLREHTRLFQRANDWDTAGRVSSRLLTGTDISAAKKWAASKPDKAPELTSLHLGFIRASEEAETARANEERAQLRAMAEAQEARAKALDQAEVAYKEKAEATRRLVFRTRIGMAIAAVLASVATAAGIIAVLNQQAALVARNEAQRADSQALSQLSSAVRETGDAVSSAWLAVAALPDPERSGEQRPYVPTAENALYQALSSAHESKFLHRAKKPPTGMATSENGSFFAAAEPDRILIWATSTSELIKEINVEDEAITTIEFSPDGEQLYTGHLNGDIFAWSWREGRKFPENPLQDESAITGEGQAAGRERIIISNDGRFLAASSDDDKLRVWDLHSSDRQLLLIFDEHDGTVIDLKFAQDSLYFLALSDDIDSFSDENELQNIEVSNWRLPNISTGRVISSQDASSPYWTPSINEAENSVSVRGTELRVGTYSDDATSFLVGTDLSMSTWDTTTSKRMSRDFHLRGSIVPSATFGNSGLHVLAVNNFGLVELFDATTGDLIKTLGRDEEPFAGSGIYVENKSRVLSFGKEDIFAVSKGGSIRLWSTHAPLDLLEIGNEEGSDAFDLTANGSKLVLGERDGSAQIWTLRKSDRGEIARDLRKVKRLHNSPISAVAFSSDGEKIAVVAEDGTGLIHSLNSGTSSSFGPIQGRFLSISFMPGDTRVVTSSSGTKTAGARIWSSNSGELLVALDHQNSMANCQSELSAASAEVRVLSAFFDQTGKRVVTASRDGVARIWDAITGALISKTSCHGEEVTMARFLGGMDRLVTVANDSKVRIWKINQEDGAKLLQAPMEHGSGGIDTVAYFEDDFGETLVTGGRGDKTLHIWRRSKEIPESEFAKVGTRVFNDQIKKVIVPENGEYIAVGLIGGIVKLVALHEAFDDIIERARLSLPRCLSKKYLGELSIEPEQLCSSESGSIPQLKVNQE